MSTLQRILFIEDDVDIQTVAQLALDQIGGFSLMLCSSSSEALHKAQEFAPDLILVDTEISNMELTSLVESLRQNEHTAAIPFIFISPHTSSQQLELYRSLDPLGVIDKPFDPIRLAIQLREIWDGNHEENSLEVVTTLELLRQDYLEKLPAKLLELQLLTDHLVGDNRDRAHLETLQQELHRMAGSAGSFGLKLLSSRARELEKTVLRGISRGASSGLTEGGRRSLSEALALLPELVSMFELPPLGTDIYTTDGFQGLSSVDEESSVIWLVEENGVLAQVICEALHQYGYRTRHYSRFNDANEAAHRDAPDLLLIDTYFAIEELDATIELEGSMLQRMAAPIVFISQHDDFFTRLRTIQLGGSGFLTKPIDIPKLIEHLERSFNEKSMQPYKVLIVDDDATLADHYRQILLGANMEVKSIFKPEQVIEAISEFRPDLVLMDVHMPEYSGVELAALIKQHEEWASLPIIYLSSQDDLAQQLRAIGSGADEYLTKPITDEHLRMTIKTRAARARQLHNLLSRDSLSGLLKHSRIKEELEAEQYRAVRNKTSLCMVMIDLDHFKNVNDTYGHAIGDRVIKGLTFLLKQRFRKSDIIGRYGGEEFAVILPDCSSEAAVGIIEDIRRRFSSVAFQANEMLFNVTLSAGVACLGECESDKTLLIAADEALYIAKKSGRDRVELYRSEAIGEGKNSQVG